MKFLPRRYERRKTGDGYVFSFTCDLCHHTVLTPEIKTNSPNDAWEYVGLHFNMCHCCSKWVCDIHYNEETMTCVECSPKKMYCCKCGHELLLGEKHCTNCGNKI